MRSSLRALFERVGLAARPRPRLGYVGAPHDASNLGDAIMRRTADRLLAPATLVDVTHPNLERRLARVGLSGPAFFDAVVLGGGTLIQPLSATLVRGLVAQGVPLFALGPGVGAWGYGMDEDLDLAEWRDLLARFEAVGVRGPLSQERLAAAGAPAVVVGDLALYETTARLPHPSPAPRFALNVLRPEDGRPVAEHPVHSGLTRLVERLVRRGWEVVPIAMDDVDVAPLEATLALAGVPRPRPHRPRTLDALQALLAPCQLTVAFRLHAAVLSTTVGVPPLSLGYRHKCLDFMRSVELEAWHVAVADTQEAGEAAFDAGARLAEVAGSLRAPLHARALAWRRRLEQAAGDVLARATRG